MADNMDVNPNPVTVANLPEVARTFVYEHIKKNLEKTNIHATFGPDEVYVVWFNFTLGNWKALCSTTLPDGRYYEITHRVASGMVFIDTYVKIDNTEVDVVDATAKHRYTHPST